jgi:hypothetical protein
MPAKRAFSFVETGFLTSCCVLFMATPCYSKSFDLDNPDIRLDLDTTVKYTGGWRVAERDSRLANSPGRDEGDYRVDKGEMIMNRADILSQMDLTYQQINGLRVSAAGWYDFGFDRNVKQSPELEAQGWQSSYNNDRYSGLVQRYYKGPSGEILDAFVFSSFNAGETPVNVRLGQHTIYWGTSVYDHFSNGIAYGQAPLDARKSAMVPGSTAQEVFLPVAQLSAQSQITPQISLAGQYFLDWKPTRFSEGGTHFSGTDYLFSGPDRRPLSPGVSIPQLDSLEPGTKHGSFGISSTWSPEFLDGEISAFYRHFDDPMPWLAPQSVNGGYRLVYPKDIDLYGLSLNRSIGRGSVGVDLSVRHNAPLNALGVSNVDNEGPRGDTLHVVTNMISALPNSSFYDAGTWTAELSYAHLMDVTKHKELYRGEGYGCDALNLDEKDGCSTRNFVGLTLQVTPQWLQILPGVNLSMPTNWRYGIHGNGATSANGQEDAYTLSLGLQADIYERITTAITYVTTYAPINTVVNGIATTGRDGFSTRDRDWVAFSIQTSF